MALDSNRKHAMHARSRTVLVLGSRDIEADTISVSLHTGDPQSAKSMTQVARETLSASASGSEAAVA